MQFAIARRASQATLLFWPGKAWTGSMRRGLAAAAATPAAPATASSQGADEPQSPGRRRRRPQREQEGSARGRGAEGVEHKAGGTRRRGRGDDNGGSKDDSKTALSPTKGQRALASSPTQVPPAPSASAPPPGWWGRRGQEKVLRVTATEEITRTAEGEVVRWPRNDWKLLRRTKGQKRLLARVAKQDAETARLLDLPASSITLPANVPRVKGIGRPLLPRGVTEAGLLPSRYWKKETGPGAVLALRPDNQTLADARPQKVNDLLALVKGARNPETRLLAVQQLQFIRTKLTVREANSVLDEAMKHFGWRAGLRYAERMGDRPEHRLSLRHFNRVVRACCRDPGLRSLRSVLRVVEEMEGQGVPPNHQTIALGLAAAAERGDAYVAERLLAYARARGIELDKRAQAKAAEALAAGRKGEEGEKALHDSEGDGEDGDGSREGSEEAVTDQEEGEANNK